MNSGIVNSASHRLGGVRGNVEGFGFLAMLHQLIGQSRPGAVTGEQQRRTWAADGNCSAAPDAGDCRLEK